MRTHPADSDARLEVEVAPTRRRSACFERLFEVFLLRFMHDEGQIRGILLAQLVVDADGGGDCS